MTDVSPSPPYTHFRFPHFFLLPFFFFCGLPSPTVVPSSMAEKCFHRNQPPGVYLADRHSFESLFSGAAPPFGRCCICRGATRSPPRQDGRAPGRIRGNFPRTQSWISCFSLVYAFLLIVFYWSREIVHRGKMGKINLGIIIDRSKFDRNNL